MVESGEVGVEAVEAVDAVEARRADGMFGEVERSALPSGFSP